MYKNFVLIILTGTFYISPYNPNLPEIYQDIVINGKTVQKGVRSCIDRYEAIKPMLNSLPKNAKTLDIGASQGFFSFKMAEEYKYRCTMIEGGYKISEQEWQTGRFLNQLCKENHALQNITLLEQLFSLNDLKKLQNLETFDLVLAFSVIHHMRESLSDPFANFIEVIDVILKLGEVVLIENPINTGDHTLFIRQALKDRGGTVIYRSPRGTLTYEIYLFDKRQMRQQVSLMPNLQPTTYHLFNGTYTTLKEE